MDVSQMRNASGARLAYVIIKIEEKLEREQYTIDRKKVGLTSDGKPRYMNDMKKLMVEEPGGYMVYFPRGHVLRMRTLDDLEHYGLKKGEAPVINLSGLNDPHSAIGKLLRAQDNAGRADAWSAMEQMVIKLACAKTGPIIMPEQVARHPETPVAA